LISCDYNWDLLVCEQIREFKDVTEAACKNAYNLPSVSEKNGLETYRLFFKRRHTVERTNLIIIRASDFLVATSKDFEGQIHNLTSLVRPDMLRLVASLLTTNQVAILLDF